MAYSPNLQDIDDLMKKSKKSFVPTSADIPSPPTFMQNLGRDLENVGGGVIDALNRYGAGLQQHLYQPMREALGIKGGIPISPHAFEVPGFDPETHPISAATGEMVGDTLPYLMPMSAGAKIGTAIGENVLPKIPAALSALGGESLASGATTAMGQKNVTPTDIGLSIAGVPAGAAAGKVLESTGRALGALSPQEHIKRLFKILSVPVKENYPNLEDEAIGKLGVSPAENASAFSNLISKKYEAQKNRVAHIFNNGVFGKIENLGQSNQVNPANLQNIMGDLDKIKLWDQELPTRSAKKDIDEWLQGDRNVQKYHFLKADIGDLAASFNRSADKKDNFIGQKLGKVANGIKADIITHLNNIDPKVADLYEAAAADWQKNVLPYKQLPRKILTQKDNNPVGFSKYFGNPALQITESPADQSSMLNILGHFNNTELPRRIMLDVLQNKTEKTPSSIVNTYKQAAAGPFKEYTKAIPDIHNEFADIGEKVSKKPIIGKLATEAALAGGSLYGFLHGGMETALPMAALFLAGRNPESRVALDTVRKGIGKGLEKGAKVPGSYLSKAALSALGGNINAN